MGSSGINVVHGYKCTVTPDYDLCENCEPEHPRSYPMIKINEPLTQMHTPGMWEFMKATGSRKGGFGRGGCFRRGRGMCGGRGRGRGRRHGGCGGKKFNPCFMKQKMEKCFEKMKQKGFFDEHKDSPCFQKMQKHFEQMQTNESNESQPSAPPAEERKCELKSQIQAIKKEAKKARAELKEKKKEQKKIEKELKKVKKEVKKEKKRRFGSEVVDHLDLDENSTQVAGTYVLKTWKVKNTGTSAWSEETIATFKKGNEKMVTPDSFNVLVGAVQPGDVTYIRAMFAIPEDAGTHKVVYRLQAPEAGKFGAPMKTFITVEPVAEEAEEPVPEPAIEEEPVPSAPVEEVFQFAEELKSLQNMCFGIEQSKAALVATEGDITGAIAILLN